MDLLNAALSYARQGIPCFPLGERSKVPLIPARDGGRGLHDATTDPDLILSWWTSHPKSNIGIRTGVVFDVVDLDGEIALEALEAARGNGERLRGPAVRTAHGMHWYVKPTGLGNRAGVLPGVDYRGQGGYITAPPSVHPSGYRYRWANPCLDDLVELPPWLLELLQLERSALNDCKKLLVGERATTYGRAALRRELEVLARAEPGTRNDSLNSAAWSLGQLVAAGALDETETVAALTQAGVGIGLGQREVERTVASGLRAGMAQPRSLV